MADANPYQVLFQYFALSVLQFLDGTVIKQGVEDLWERFSRALPEAPRQRLADFPRKFYVIPYAMKDYRAHDETPDLIVQCLVHQHRMRIDYHGLMGEGHVHEFDPYTLAMYRGGRFQIAPEKAANMLNSRRLAEEEGSRTLRRPYGRPRGFEDRGGHRAPSSSVRQSLRDLAGAAKTADKVWEQS